MRCSWMDNGWRRGEAAQTLQGGQNRGPGAIDETPRLAFVAQVGQQPRRLATRGAHRCRHALGRFLGTPTVDDDIGSPGCQLQGDGSVRTTAGSDVTDVAYATEKELEKFHMTSTATRVLHRAFAMDRERRNSR